MIRNGTDVWTWSSQDKTATHRHAARRPRRGHDAPRAARPTCPRRRSRRPTLALKAISPTTDGERPTAPPGSPAAPPTSWCSRPRTPASLVASVRHRHRRRAARAAAGPGLRQGLDQAGLRGRLHARSTSAGRTRRSSPSTRRRHQGHRAARCRPTPARSKMRYGAPRPGRRAVDGGRRAQGRRHGLDHASSSPPCRRQSQSGSGDQQSLKAMLELLPRVTGVVGLGPPAARARCSPRCSPTTAGSPSAP